MIEITVKELLGVRSWQPKAQNDMKLLDHPLARGVDAVIGERCHSMVVGVSGGADSVALLCALQRSRWRPRSLVVAHLDHGLRPDSASDAHWVEELTASLNLTSAIERQGVPGIATARGVGHEEAARECRYAFFSRVATEHDCSHIAVGHTADDQAETVLHQLVRGSGLGGLRGMPTLREFDGRFLVRPLLAVSRADVIDYLQRIDQAYLQDETNADERYTRNRVRHTLLPLLQNQFNPQVIPALCRLSRQAREIQELIELHGRALLESAIDTRDARQVVLNVVPLREANRHLVREAFRLLFVAQDWPRKRMGFDEWDRLADLAQSARSPKSIDLPCQFIANYRRGLLTLRQGAARIES